MAEQSIPSSTELDATGIADARAIDRYFQISARGSTQRREVVAGITTFMAMVFAVFFVPGMLGKAGFDTSVVFVAVCLTTALGSLLMGLWAKLPIAIGCAISLTAFMAFGLVLGQKRKRSTTDAHQRVVAEGVSVVALGQRRLVGMFQGSNAS